MGKVNSLHGSLPALKLKHKVWVICTNEKCHRKFTAPLVLKSKRVCPYCKKPIPAILLKKLKSR
jgi:hypothetical protein